MVDERTRKTIEHGRRIRAVLGQRRFAPASLGEQVALLVAGGSGLLDCVPLDRIETFRAALGPWLAEHCPEILGLDDTAPAIPLDVRTRLQASLAALVETVGGAEPDERVREP